MEFHFKRSSSTLLLIILCVHILSTEGTDYYNQGLRTYKYVKGYSPSLRCRTGAVTVKTTIYITKEVKIPHYSTQEQNLRGEGLLSLTTITEHGPTKYLTQTLYNTKYLTTINYTPVLRTTYQTVYKTISDIEHKTKYQTLTKYSYIDHTTEKYLYVTKTETVSVPHSIEPSATIDLRHHQKTVENGRSIIGPEIDVRNYKPAIEDAWEWSQ